jgi:hypothetical protein
MLQTFVVTLPLALAASVSVTSLLLFFSILVAKDKQVENGLAYIAGGVLAYAAMAVVVLFSFAKAAPAGSPHHGGVHAAADFILAALCVILVIKSYFEKGHPEEKKDFALPGGAFAYVGAGALVRIASANTLPPFIAAVKDVSGAHWGAAPSTVLCVLVILITMMPLILPWTLFLFNKKRALVLIGPVSLFLEKNKKMISNTVLVVIAFYMAFHGLKHLGIV